MIKNSRDFNGWICALAGTMVEVNSGCHSRLYFGLILRKPFLSFTKLVVFHTLLLTQFLTVLKSIGSSLAFIVEGGRFIMQKDLTINLLVANFKVMVITLSLYSFLLLYFFFQNIITEIHIISNVASRLLIRTRKHEWLLVHVVHFTS